MSKLHLPFGGNEALSQAPPPPPFGWSPSPAIAGAENDHPANVPQFFAKFSAPRSDSAKMV
jgi:hypothetical protein